ncbi:L,D-transpeptidase [Varibaculum vaginae]|uniref:L,D-transpeptidase n=1 Tax=Varibaculum vaginae TaxID=2364797 RepID=UPI00135A6D2F|nr:L,D-transpeptidase [Varibaculum vaginae]
MSKKTKITVGVIIALLTALVAAFAIYVSYYAVGKKALPGTMVGEVKVSGLKASQIKKQLDTAETNNKVTFSGQGTKETTLTPKEIGYRVNSTETARQATARSSALNYVTSLFVSREIPVVYDIEATVTNKLSLDLAETDSKAKAVTEPSVQPNEQGTGFQAVPGKDGFGADTKALIAGADKVLSSQKNQKATLNVGVVKPLMDIKLAQKLADSAQKFTHPKVTLKAGDKEIVADQKAKVSFVNIPVVSRHAKLTADDKTVADWVNKNKEAVEVKKVNGQRLVNSEGKVLKTKTESKDGIKVTNGEELIKKITKNFDAGKDSYLTFKTAVDKADNEDKTVADGAEKLVYWASPDEKWIDINLSSREMTAYEGAKPVRGPIKVIIGYPNTPTVTGQYEVYLKYPVQTMRGLNPDGSKYVAPGVPSVLYFTGSYAIHGSPWWSSGQYFEEGHGSHGCVNTPPVDAQWIYNWAPIGTVVVTHH